MIKFRGKLILGVSVLAFCSMITGCNRDEDDPELAGDWEEKSNFDGNVRRNAVSFTIGDKAYMGTGFDGRDKLNDFWEYDPVGNAWSQKAPVPGVVRSNAVGFGTDTKGYIGTGSGDNESLKDFYSYDPTTNTWDSISEFGGTERYGAVAFTVNGVGYVGSGFDGSYTKDFWTYDEATDTWSAVRSIGGDKRLDANSFVIGSKAYVMAGINNGAYLDDLWEYNASSDSWTQKAGLIKSDANEDNDEVNYDIRRRNAVGFQLNGNGYMSTGYRSGALGSTWKYSQSEDKWIEVKSLGGAARDGAVSFEVNGEAFVTTGVNGTAHFDDIWKYIE